MAEEKPTEIPKKASTASREEKVQELYRIADLLHSTTKSQEPLTDEEWEALLQRFREILD